MSILETEVSAHPGAHMHSWNVSVLSMNYVHLFIYIFLLVK